MSFLVLRSLNSRTGFARANGTTTSGNAGSGTITNNKLIDASQNNQSIGTLNGDNLNGTFTHNNRTITTVGRRTF